MASYAGNYSASYSGTDVKDSYVGAFGVVLLGALVTAVPVLFHLAGQPIAIALCVLLSVILTAVAAPSVPTALIFAYLFQNLFVALVSPQFTGIDQLNAIRAYNFVMTATVWLVLTIGYWLERNSLDRRLRLMIDVTTGVMVLIGAYFVLGVGANPSSAVTYLRNIAAPFLLFQIFALVAYRYPVPLIKPLTIIAAIATVYGLLEIVAQKEVLRLVNGDVYINWRVRQEYESGAWLRELQETGRVMRSYLDTLVIDFLNTSLIDLDFKLYRLVGPNFHSISFAYALAFFAIVLAAAGRWWWPLLVLPPLLGDRIEGRAADARAHADVPCARVVPAHVPEPVLVHLHARGLCVRRHRGRHPRRRLSCDRVHRRIARLSCQSARPRHRRGRQSVAFGVDLRLEPLAAARPHRRGGGKRRRRAALPDGSRGLRRPRRPVLDRADALAAIPPHRDRLYAAAALGVAAVTVNGIFQEEAMFAPLALGFMCGFAGLMLGRAYRHVPLRASRA